MIYSNFPIIVFRWYNHISSFGAEKSKFPAGTGKISAPAKMEVDDDDDEVDLFGSDVEEVNFLGFITFYI